MRKLNLETLLRASVDKIWSLFTKVNDYPKYIEYCHKAELIGEFQVGSVWYDWSTVVYVPYKVAHKINRLEPEKLIIYIIPLPGGGQIQQKFVFEGQGESTRVYVEITVEFDNQLLDFLLGGLVEKRNREMINKTIANIQEKIHEIN